MKIIEWSIPEFKSFHMASKALMQLKAYDFTHVLLLPFFESQESPYCITSHNTIKPDFGNWNDFESFCKLANGLNLNIGVDVVLNHVSPKHILAKYSTQASPIHTNWTDVWQLNHAINEVETYLMNHLHQLKNCGVQFIRLDAAFHIPTSLIEFIKRNFNFEVILDDYIQPEKLVFADFILNHHFRNSLIENQKFPSSLPPRNEIIYFSNHDTIETASPFLEFMEYTEWVQHVLNCNHPILMSHYEHISSISTYSFRKG
jgi:1,4-alpha-glucan branching enzyme